MNQQAVFIHQVALRQDVNEHATAVYADVFAGLLLQLAHFFAALSGGRGLSGYGNDLFIFGP